MLPLAVVDEIRQLLALGELSQRQIAEQLHVSRGTVHNIASGKRGHFGSEPKENSAERFSIPERCPGCGAMVAMPCVLCRAREYGANRLEHRRIKRSYKRVA
jgi:transcriptional regulator with XRE-family HTH domain